MPLELPRGGNGLPPGFKPDTGRVGLLKRWGSRRLDSLTGYEVLEPGSGTLGIPYMDVLDGSACGNDCEGPVEGLGSGIKSDDWADGVNRGSVSEESTPASIGSRRIASYGEGVVDVAVA